MTEQEMDRIAELVVQKLAARLIGQTQVVYPTPPNHYPPLQPFYPSSFPDYPSSAYTSDNNGTIQSVDPTQIYSINPR